MKKVVLVCVLLFCNSALLCKSINDLEPEERVIKRGRLLLADKDLTSLEGLDEIPKIETVTVLSLSNNKLEEVPAGIFDNLKSLKELYLADNQLQELPEGIFSELVNLQTLDLARNFLSAQQIDAIRYQVEVRGQVSDLDVSGQQGLHLEPNVTEERFKRLKLPESEKVCSICLDTTQGAETYLNYKTACEPKPHRFHAKCLEEWLKTSKSMRCPLCRQNVFTGGESEEVAYDHTKQKKHVHVAKNANRKKKKEEIAA